MRNCSEVVREELGYIRIFAIKGREQESKRPGLTKIILLMCTSAISILSFHSLHLLPLEITAFTDDHDILCFILNYILSLTEIPPMEEKGDIRI